LTNDDLLTCLLHHGLVVDIAPTGAEEDAAIDGPLDEHLDFPSLCSFAIDVTISLAADDGDNDNFFILVVPSLLRALLFILSLLGPL
jgi:hypothetical protein